MGSPAEVHTGGLGGGDQPWTSREGGSSHAPEEQVCVTGERARPQQRPLAAYLSLRGRLAVQAATRPGIVLAGAHDISPVSVLQRGDLRVTEVTLFVSG